MSQPGDAKRQTRQTLSPSGDSRQVQQLMKRGKAAALAGKRAEARYFFESVLAVRPDHAAALLWLAYLAGGGRPSLVYLARLLEVEPTNQRAHAAIRWARKRARPQRMAPPVSRAGRPAKQDRRRPRKPAYFTILMLVLIGGLATVAFAGVGLGLPQATPTPVPIVAVVTRTPTAPPDTPTPVPSPTATEVPSPTASPLPSPTLTLLRRTATVTPTATPTPVASATPTPLPTTHIGAGFRWIDVDLTHQRLVAYEGQTPVRSVTVSTGLPRTPTVTGRFKIYVKYRSAPMSGPGYYLPNVPYVMYFYRGYGLHGTYWHNNFGRPMSHGCVNLPTPQAEWLYNWASVGTLVVIHY